MNISKIKIFFALGLFFMGIYSCDLGVSPSDSISTSKMQDPSSIVYATDGNYSMMKDILEFQGSENDGNTYVRHLTQLCEFNGDNTCLSGRTSDPLYETATYKLDATMSNISYFWWCAYKIIYGANNIIASVSESDDHSMNELLGENYFLRAMCHFDLVRLFARPYNQGRDNPGVVLMDSPVKESVTRATVGEVYDLIVSDLQRASSLMQQKYSRGNSYANQAAALALLSRVYLYMGENEKVVETADKVFDLVPISNLEPTSTFPDYFANALSSSETLFAVAHTAADNKGQASIGSMYLNDGIGWGEVYASESYLDLLEQYPEDVRNKFIRPVYTYDGSGKHKYWIYYSVLNIDNNNLEDVNYEVTYDTSAGRYKFTDENGNIVYVNKSTSEGKDVYSIVLNGKTQIVHFGYEMDERNGYPKYYVLKYSYQDDDPMLSSPVILRLAEVVLNRAEAYAKLGKTDEALADVNTIRERAGLSGDELFSSTNMHGYDNVLDVVLDERRLELAFEGQRAFDVFRNGKSLDRRYPGVQPAVVISPDDERIINYIPQSEILVSNIEQNP
ncbi:MAG: RagB/SusD family nutrient uptake outer membrane protein [Bacteroidales bacterium]|jgi:tetratricopeptide (TPR) repeat protein|nr:RagB/SusD family nutrient uptake outer membrane protein [Bacteroidales bacterium]